MAKQQKFFHTKPCCKISTRKKRQSYYDGLYTSVEQRTIRKTSLTIERNVNIKLNKQYEMFYYACCPS